MHLCVFSFSAFSALTLLVGWQEGQAACKKLEWWGTDMVICLERDADFHMAQLTPLPLTVSCFSKIQIGFTFLVPAHPGCLGKRAVKRVCVCLSVAPKRQPHNSISQPIPHHHCYYYSFNGLFSEQPE